MKKILFFLLSFIFLATGGHAASITGKAIYKGKRPKLRMIKMGGDPICLTKNQGNDVLPKSIVLGPEFEMKNVFLRIVEGLPKKNYPTPSEPVVVSQEGCMYNPPVFGVMKGQSVKILNPDGTLHNVHAMSKINKEFNIAMPKFRKEVTKSWDKEEFMFEMKCDVHPWMVAYVAVLNHPYYTVTNEAGVYTIDNLAPGDYVIEAWQQRLEPQRVSVAVAEGKPTEVNFTFQRPDGK